MARAPAKKKTPKKKEKEKRKKDPPLMLEKTAKKVAEQVRKGEKVSVSGAMRESGYSDTSARSMKVKESPHWNALLSLFLPEEKVLEKHSELMDTKKVEVKYMSLSLTNDDIRDIIAGMGFELIGIKRTKESNVVSFAVPDNVSQARAVDMAYKVRSRYQPDVQQQINIFAKMTDVDLMNEIHQLQKDLRK